MNDVHLVLHGLAIKKNGSAEAIAGIAGLDAARVDAVLKDLVGRGRVTEVQGKFLLTPASRMALDSEYSGYYGKLRANADFVEAYEMFERINPRLKALISSWQTIEVGGEIIANDHSHVEHDQKVIDRLGELHEQADHILDRLAGHLPRFQVYRDKLLDALENAEDGEIEWVSGARIESYHTVWFELHEDLLRLMGRDRVE